MYGFLGISNGKSLIAKTSGASQLIYAASMLSLPTSLTKNVQAELFNFLWKNKKDKIKRLVMYQSLEEGVHDFVNFPAVVKSLRMAWIGRFLSNSQNSWNAVPNHYLSSHGGLQFLLRFNYNATCINNLSIFYRELLQYFQEFKNKTKIYVIIM